MSQKFREGSRGARTAASSESESDSDDEDDRPTRGKRTTREARRSARPTSESDSSSDEEEIRPLEPAPRRSSANKLDSKSALKKRSSAPKQTEKKEKFPSGVEEMADFLEDYEKRDKKGPAKKPNKRAPDLAEDQKVIRRLEREHENLRSESHEQYGELLGRIRALEARIVALEAVEKTHYRREDPIFPLDRRSSNELLRIGRQGNQTAPSATPQGQPAAPAATSQPTVTVTEAELREALRTIRLPPVADSARNRFTAERSRTQARSSVGDSPAAATDTAASCGASTTTSVSQSSPQTGNREHANGQARPDSSQTGSPPAATTDAGQIDSSAARVSQQSASTTSSVSQTPGNGTGTQANQNGQPLPSDPLALTAVDLSPIRYCVTTADGPELIGGRKHYHKREVHEILSKDGSEWRVRSIFTHKIKTIPATALREVERPIYIADSNRTRDGKQVLKCGRVYEVQHQTDSLEVYHLFDNTKHVTISPSLRYYLWPIRPSIFDLQPHLVAQEAQAIEIRRGLANYPGTPDADRAAYRKAADELEFDQPVSDNYTEMSV